MAEKTEYGASAVVTLRLRVTSSGHWGGGATVAEVMRIGSRETVDSLKAALAKSGLQYEIVGEPEVGAITWSRPI